MKALTPKVINGRIIIINKNDYDEVHITVDEMEDVLNNIYQQGAEKFAEWLEDNSYLNWVGEGNDVNSMSAEEALAEWQKEN